MANLDSFLEAAERDSRGKKRPPLEQWSKQSVRQFDMRIDRDGDWFHEGDKIKRESLVTLLSRLLWREGNHYFLLGPSEKLLIEVEALPLVVTNFRVLDGPQNRSWQFLTKTDDLIELPCGSHLEMGVFGRDQLPMLHVRDKLYASLHRNVFYQLLEFPVDEASDCIEINNCRLHFDLNT